MSAWYDGMFHDDRLHTLHSFKLYGWGRLTPDAIQYVQEIGDENAGSINEPAKVLNLLYLQGVLDRAKKVSSVRWY